MTDSNFPVLNFKDFITADGDSLTTDSRKVAAVHGKRHDDVIRLIRKRIAESGEFGLRNFAETSYVDDFNRPQPMFRMTKNGYAFLVGKMTGKKAVQFQIAYINAFDSMADFIRNQKTGLMYDYFKLQLEHKGRKAKASFHGRGLNEWKGEKPILESAMHAIEDKMQPQLALVGAAA